MSVIDAVEKQFKKPHVVDVKSGDTVRVHQKIREGNKERVQVFEGLVIRTKRKSSHTASITVRRIASGVGVEKTYLIHSPLVTKIEVKKRSKVRRNYLSYMRERTGKSARLTSVDFDRESVNAVPDPEEKPVTKASEVQEPEAAEKPAADNPNPKDEPSKTENKPEEPTADTEAKAEKADQKDTAKDEQKKTK